MVFASKLRFYPRQGYTHSLSAIAILAVLAVCLSDCRLIVSLDFDDELEEDIATNDFLGNALEEQDASLTDDSDDGSNDDAAGNCSDSSNDDSAGETSQKYLPQASRFGYVAANDNRSVE